MDVLCAIIRCTLYGVGGILQVKSGDLMQLMTFCKVFNDVKEIWLMEVTDFCKEFGYNLHDVQLNVTRLLNATLVTALYKLKK